MIMIETKPIIPLDPWAAILYERNGLGEKPTFEEMREIAIRLLANLNTLYPGADIVLARKVPRGIYERIEDPNMTPDERFDILWQLQLKESEERQCAVPEVGK